MPVARIQLHRLTAKPTTPHVLYVLPALTALPDDLPHQAQWLATLKRREISVAELAKTPQALDVADGSKVALVSISADCSRFDRFSRLRQAVMLLLNETPAALTIVALEVSSDVARDAAYVALINGAPLPASKKKSTPALKVLHLHAPLNEASLRAVSAQADANVLVRELTVLAPNQLTPASYRQRIRQWAKQGRWQLEEFSYKRLQRMGAGAFCAVAQGSAHEDAAIVHVSWSPRNPAFRLALVGKGICFDTGGHNLKSARYMAGMHEDMNGSAVALALFKLIVDLKLPIAVDGWLAIAHNHISANAFTQNDIIRALNGTTIEIVHTDAEGRMVLADTLTLAAKNKPDLIVDFATLTGSMHTALGNRYSGIFASSGDLAAQAVRAGQASGERVCAFPLDADYESALDSAVADIKQCTLDGDADHILAARFLQRFTAGRPWLHVDLSAVRCAGGLGPCATDVTGFGVGWGVNLLAACLSEHN